MPWCPNCKAEFQEGVKVCSDCDIELVEDLAKAEVLEPFFQAEDKKVAEKLASFFEYSDLRAEVRYNEETEVYIVLVPPKQQSQAKKLYQAFCFVESTKMERNNENKTSSVEHDSEEEPMDIDQTLETTEDALNEKDEDDLKAPGDDISDFDEVEKPSYAYVMKEDQYKDLTGTVWIFLFFGLAGSVLVILNIIGVFSFINGWIAIGVMGALFLSFIYIAFSTHQKAKKVQAEIEAENKLTEEINHWLEQTVTESFLTTLHNDDISEELNYIKNIETIKEMLLKEFGPQNLAYLDRIIDEYYSTTFDNNN